MIACILAGGEGTRLRPVSCRSPKPMTKLITHPVMGHMLNLLRKNDVEKACVTLRHMPAAIRDYFGDGEEWGVQLSYFEETVPLGTAGGAANCDFPDNEEILIVSGDGVCDFDLRAALEFHRSRGAEATILLSRQNDPLEYGIVEYAPDGHVLRFVEKPGWNRVSTDTVNTGIYILSPSVMRRIVRGRASDFSRDVFPEMLRRGDPLYAYIAEGYWCDIGDCRAYLRCVHDALDGRIKIDLPAFKNGICSLSPIPDSVQICPPVYIGRDVIIERSARIGPYTVIDDGAMIGRDAVIEGSICRGNVDSGAYLTDAIAEKNSHVGVMARLDTGSVLGEGARLGAHSELRPGVRVWPNCDTGSDTIVRFNLCSDTQTGRIRLSPDASITGTVGDTLTPEFFTGLGSALADVSAGTVGCACSGGDTADACIQAIISGVRVCGEDAALLPAHFAAETAFSAYCCGCAVAVHITQNGRELTVHIFDGDGLPADSTTRRKIENLIASGDFHRTCDAGRLISNTKGADQYFRVCLEYGRAQGRTFRTRGASRSCATLESILWLIGAKLTGTDSSVTFMPSETGFELTAYDENGDIVDDSHTLACAFYLAAESVKGGDIACPEDAPHALEQIASAFGKKLIRPSDTAHARDMLAHMRYMTDAVMRAVYISAELTRRGTTLAHLVSLLPEFSICRDEIPLRSGRAQFMRSSAAAGIGIEGVRYEPSHLREALRIIAESSCAEAAQELCSSFCEQAKKLDTDIKRRKV